MMKKIVPVVVLIAMLFNAAGYYIVYEFNRFLIRREVTSLVRHGYFDHELSRFSVFNPSANPNFRRVDDREIVYNGNLYDVVKEVPNGRIITFYCIHDSKEELLIAGLKSMQHKKKALDLMQYLVTIALPVTNERPHPQETKALIYPLLCENYTGNPVIPFTPPPETI
ncbi:MAG: hypothetical protein NTU51_02100 [Bacteroidetes bacterium]|nr:hypothetical protein [Bacteroidota bacterium]